ncbi:MAG: hypothetical protein HZA37_00745 [Parcubacteria group bacterium]|nr:hypothetical protein [Parcubacteria group bacterium]
MALQQLGIGSGGKLKDFYRLFVLPTSILAGTSIGAGVFSLPFVFNKVGVGAGFIYLAVFCLVFVAVHLMYADVILRTEGRHRFVGYARFYLGKSASWLATAMAVLSMVVVLLIYLVLSVSFVNLIVPDAMGDFYKMAVFWLLGSTALFLSVRRLALAEFLVLWGIITVIGAIFIFGIFEAGAFGKIDWLFFSPAYFLLPFGPILFSLSGRPAIPDVIDYYDSVGGDRRGLMKKALIWGTVIPAVVYAVFVLGVLFLSGEVSEDAISGIAGALPRWVLFGIGALGVVSLWSSYIVIGMDVRDILAYDFRLPKVAAVLAVFIAPMALFLAGFQNFLALVSIAGGVFLALEGIFIIAMWKRAASLSSVPSVFFAKMPAAAIYALAAVFTLGMVYEIIKGVI